MARIFCLKHEIELEAESHSGSYYCSECDTYPFVQDTYLILEHGEILRYNDNGHIYIDTLENMKDEKQ